MVDFDVTPKFDRLITYFVSYFDGNNKRLRSEQLHRFQRLLKSCFLHLRSTSQPLLCHRFLHHHHKLSSSSRNIGARLSQPRHLSLSLSLILNHLEFKKCNRRLKTFDCTCHSHHIKYFGSPLSQCCKVHPIHNPAISGGRRREYWGGIWP